MAVAGHHILIAGAGCGSGLEVSKRVAQQGSNPILVCRTEEQGAHAVAEVEPAVPEALVRLKGCDHRSRRPSVWWPT